MGWSNTKSEEIVDSLKDVKDEIKSKYKIHDTITGDSKCAFQISLWYLFYSH